MAVSVWMCVKETCDSSYDPSSFVAVLAYKTFRKIALYMLCTRKWKSSIKNTKLQVCSPGSSWDVWSPPSWEGSCWSFGTGLWCSRPGQHRTENLPSAHTTPQCHDRQGLPRYFLPVSRSWKKPMTAQQRINTPFWSKNVRFSYWILRRRKNIKAYVYMLHKANISGQIILKVSNLKCILII